jgi:hypothetical protein
MPHSSRILGGFLTPTNAGFLRLDSPDRRSRAHVELLVLHKRLRLVDAQPSGNEDPGLSFDTGPWVESTTANHLVTVVGERGPGVVEDDGPLEIATTMVRSESNTDGVTVSAPFHKEVTIVTWPCTPQDAFEPSRAHRSWTTDREHPSGRSHVICGLVQELGRDRLDIRHL